MTQSEIEHLQENIGKVAEALQPIFETINDAMQRFAESVSTAFKPVIADIQRALSVMQLIRFPHESIADYLARNPHLIDNPDLRWEYQCYIWQTPLRLFRQWRHRK